MNNSKAKKGNKLEIGGKYKEKCREINYKK